MGVAAALAALVFALGASIGSFLNVVIYRLPAGLSLVRPASRCPACETPIKARHNVPVLGWLALRGRCAACGVRISPRYPLVELTVGLLALALFHQLAGGWMTPERLLAGDMLADVLVPFVLYLAFLAALVAVTFIDLDHFIIPDAITLPGIPLGVLAAWAGGHALGVTWQDALIGAVAGAGVIIVLILAYGALTGREGMGGGDWKLLGMIGAWLGWQPLGLVLLLASLQGILLALVLGRAFAVEELPPDPAAGTTAAAERVADEGASLARLAIPFGPFLALAAAEVLLFHGELMGLLERWVSAAP